MLLGLFVSFALASPNATFSPAYRDQNRGKWSVEVPEVRELLNTAIAITPEGLAGDLLGLHRVMANDDPEFKRYYRALLETFLPHYREPAVQYLQKILKGPRAGEVYPLYNLVSYGYRFEKNQIVPTGVHSFFTSDGTHTFDRSREQKEITKVFKDLETLARKSHFRRFYETHQEYYQKLIARYRERANIGRIWKWLQPRFQMTVDSYRIMISPLVYGFHTDGENEEAGFKEIVISVNAPDEKMSMSRLERSVFTEIDETYLNPVTERWLPEIERALTDPKLWANDSALKFYSRRQDVFTEYISWALFLLYAKDSYDAENFKQAYTEVTERMMNLRGFVKFRPYADFLLSVYPKFRDKPIEALYSPSLQWFKENQK